MWVLITAFLLLSVLIWSILMLRIKMRTVLKSELNFLHGNVNIFDPRCLESREMHKTKIQQHWGTPCMCDVCQI